jgi:hypothetical protein
MIEEIIELVQDCKLVQEGSEPDGHDCWGVREFYYYKYVLINGKKKKCFDGWYVIHDGVKVKEVLTDYLLKSRKEMQAHLKETGFETPREYAAYLKGKDEGKNKS